MTEVSYCTREDVKSTLDVAETARINAQIDREIQASSRSIEGELKRYFYPLVATQTFDWPDHQFATPWRLWLDEWELTSVTQVLAAGVDITSSVLLRPDGAVSRGRPYTKLEVDLSSVAAFNAGSTFQRSISVAGAFGFCAAETPGGAMATAFTDTAGTSGTCSDGSLVGVGSLIRVDSERMIVTGKAMASTGQTITAIGAVNNLNVVTVSGGTFDANEVIMVDAEKMRVDDVTGTQLTVTRAWDGTILAAHTTNAAVYAARALTLARGVLGTAAAAHSANATIAVHAVPSLIRDLCVAETINTLSQARRGYTQALRRGNANSNTEAREVSTGLDDLRTRVANAYARKMRTRTAARLI